jgi:N-methylhydantoinase B
MAELSGVELEVFRHALAGAAEEMGVALRRAAYSPNIKERADCSAAVFDPDGAMVAQAEHIPVHLGAMPASVRAVLDTYGALRPGEQVCLNDPYLGGTHLPDLTLVAGVFTGSEELLGYVANRAHHADVGGAAPGSMPATATEIAMEGLRIPPILIADAHGERSDVVALIAANSRTPSERRGDLRAQFAANHVGAQRLRELANRLGPLRLRQAMAAVCDYSDRRVRAAVRQIPDGCYRYCDVLEVGAGVSIRAAVTVDGDEVTIDFAGTDPQIPVNLNAVFAVTQSCAMFVFRMLTDPDAPPNAGCYRSLRVRAPEGSVVNARFPAPSAAGNVETSQRIVDVLLGCFAQAIPERVPAASQGTMNNLTIGGIDTCTGNEFSYYETVAGGMGARPSLDGMSGVHTHMTNSLNTPADALEYAYPLRVREYRLRRDSGGAGRQRGGDGVIREVETLVPARMSLLADRRKRGPYGLFGGVDGAVGQNEINGQKIDAKSSHQLQAGDRIRLETPGGGGWGPRIKQMKTD